MNVPLFDSVLINIRAFLGRRCMQSSKKLVSSWGPWSVRSSPATEEWQKQTMSPHYTLKLGLHQVFHEFWRKICSLYCYSSLKYKLFCLFRNIFAIGRLIFTFLYVKPIIGQFFCSVNKMPPKKNKRLEEYSVKIKVTCLQQFLIRKLVLLQVLHPQQNRNKTERSIDDKHL